LDRKDFSLDVTDRDTLFSGDDMGGGQDEAVFRNKSTGADTHSAFVQNLGQRPGDVRGWCAHPHAVRSQHGGERGGKGVTELTGLFQGGLGGGELVLMEKTATQDPLNLRILRSDFQGGRGRLLRLSVAAGKVESPCLQFAGCGVVLIPPEGLTGRDDGPFASLTRGPKLRRGFGLGIEKIRKKNKYRQDPGRPGPDFHERVSRYRRFSWAAGGFKPSTS